MSADQRASITKLNSAIQVATWNVLTLNGVGYQVALMNELEKYNFVVPKRFLWWLPVIRDRTAL